MAKGHAHRPAPGGRRRKLRKPDPAPLADIRYPSDTGIQPDWIVERYPDLVPGPGMQHQLTSVREAEHRGHMIRIVTTYAIEIDGHPVHLHAAVDDNGQLHCHTTPYTAYPSAIDLVKTLISRFPEAVAAIASGHGPTHGGGHDHGGRHGHGHAGRGHGEA